MTTRFQTSVIVGLFGYEEHCVRLLLGCHLGWVVTFVPLSLSLPVWKMELTVPVPPPHRALGRVKGDGAAVGAVKAIKPTAGCSFEGRWREWWSYWERRAPGRGDYLGDAYHLGHVLIHSYWALCHLLRRLVFQLCLLKCCVSGALVPCPSDGGSWGQMWLLLYEKERLCLIFFFLIF